MVIQICLPEYRRRRDMSHSSTALGKSCRYPVTFQIFAFRIALHHFITGTIGDKKDPLPGNHVH